MAADEVTWDEFCQWARAAGATNRMLSRWDDCLVLQGLFEQQLSRQVH